MTSVSGQAAEVSVMSRTAWLLRVDGDAVDQAEVDDVDAELGVDDVAHGLLDVGDVGGGSGRLAHDLSLLVAVSLSCWCVVLLSMPAWCNASVKAIHPSSAHFTRAGYLRDAGEGDAVADDVLVAGVGALGGEHRAHRLVASSAPRRRCAR